MISMLRGRVLDVFAGEAIFDVNGVGYAVRVPATYIAKKSDEVTLYIHTVVREDSINLFGFETLAERNCFRVLYSASGVGPKTAMGIMSFYSVSDLERIMANRDVLSLSKVPGIGKKTAEKMVVELKDKLGSNFSGTISAYSGAQVSVHEELVQALVNFGYKRNDAVNALKPKTDDINKGRPLEEILRETLRGMM
jgi:Holliday junction DNA helicase RuvA